MAEIDESIIERLIERLDESSRKTAIEIKSQGSDSINGLRTELTNISKLLKNLSDKTVSEDQLKSIQKQASVKNAGNKSSSKEKVVKTKNDINPKLSNFGKGLDKLDGSLVGLLAAFDGAKIFMLNFVASQLDTFVSTYQSAATTGAAFSEGLVNLRLLAAQSNLSLDNFNKIIIKSSRSLVTLGIKGFVDLQNKVRDNIMAHNMYGMTVEQVTNVIADYLEVQRSTGALEQLTAFEQQRSATRFIGMMANLSAASGFAVETLRSDFAKQMKSPDLQAFLMGATKEQRRAVEIGAGALAGLPADIQGIFRTGVVMGSTYIDKAQQQLNAYAPRTARLLNEFAIAARNGTLTAKDAIAFKAAIKASSLSEAKQIALFASLGHKGAILASSLAGAMQGYDPKKAALTAKTDAALLNFQQNLSKVSGAFSNFISLIAANFIPVIKAIASSLGYVATGLNFLSKMISGVVESTNIFNRTLLGIASILSTLYIGKLIKNMFSNLFGRVINAGIVYLKSASVLGESGAGIGTSTREGASGVAVSEGKKAGKLKSFAKGLFKHPGRLAARGLKIAAKGVVFGIIVETLIGAFDSLTGDFSGKESIMKAFDFASWGAIIGSLFGGVLVSVVSALGLALGVITAPITVPIGIVVGVLAAAGATLGVIVANWKSIVSTFTGIWDSIIEFFRKSLVRIGLIKDEAQIEKDKFDRDHPIYGTLGAEVPSIAAPKSTLSTSTIEPGVGITVPLHPHNTINTEPTTSGLNHSIVQELRKTNEHLGNISEHTEKAAKDSSYIGFSIAN